MRFTLARTFMSAAPQTYSCRFLVEYKRASIAGLGIGLQGPCQGDEPLFLAILSVDSNPNCPDQLARSIAPINWPDQLSRSTVPINWQPSTAASSTDPPAKALFQPRSHRLSSIGSRGPSLGQGPYVIWVRIVAPSAVTATVCSKCAARPPSAVTCVQ